MIRVTQPGSAIVNPQNLSNEMRSWVEIALLQMSFVSWRAIEETQRVLERILKSATSEGREKYGYKRDYTSHGVKHLCENALAEIRMFYKQHNNIMQCKTQDELYQKQENFSLALDEAEEMLAPALDDMRAHFHKKCFAKSLSTPEDPQLMEDAMVALTWLTLADAVYMYWKTDGALPQIDKIAEYRFLQCSDICRRFSLATQKLDLRDARHPEQKCKFNYMGVFKSQEGISNLEHVRNILFTTTFIDRIIIARDGRDMQFRNVGRSLLSGGIYDKEIYNSLPHE